MAKTQYIFQNFDPHSERLVIVKKSFDINFKEAWHFIGKAYNMLELQEGIVESTIMFSVYTSFTFNFFI